MPQYYTGAVKYGTAMAQATPPYMWTADGKVCVDSNGVPVFGVACAGQPRPALECPSGYVVVSEPAGVSRVCVPASQVESHPWTIAKRELPLTAQRARAMVAYNPLTFPSQAPTTTLAAVPTWMWLALGAAILFVLISK